MNWIFRTDKFLLYFLPFLMACGSQALVNQVQHNASLKKILLTPSTGAVKLEISYDSGCSIKQLWVHGSNVLAPAGVFTGIVTSTETVSSLQLTQDPQVTVTDSSVLIAGIRYGTAPSRIEESWFFLIDSGAVTWTINRTYHTSFIAEDAFMPQWNFAGLSTWKGGILDNGGVIWCKYLASADDTYGVHTGGTTYWNEVTGDGLSIQGKSIAPAHMATKFSHGKEGVFSATQLFTEQAVKPRHQLSRMVHGRFDVFAPFQVNAGELTATYKIEYIRYADTYSRGDLKSISAEAVRELMNTTARYGVVDNEIVGANGWLTNWKCLHEPFFAQLALGIMDSNYTRNLAATLNRERDLAMLPDGRVLSRWHNEKGDEIPGTYNDSTGYYEAMWGYTIDSQTGYVLNVSELFDLTGDLNWLKGHQQSCEKALDWLLKRDENNNKLYEMVNRTTKEAKASDWIDIVWASYENAFVNAQLYSALLKWANCEQVLNNPSMAARYKQLAADLKNAFNRSTKQGGFWLEEKQQYIYWRDADGSIHGDNLVTPVNFMAIASGICDDPARIGLILDQIERRTSAEQLFHWPLCFDSFERTEVHANNWPFPTYENGDIFPSWGGIGIRSYVQYDRKLALKYIKNLLQQYQLDGLSSQRYSRTTQKGLGSDILAGISTGVVALYPEIYGVQPRWNRFVLNPKLVPELNGTNFDYWLRGTWYKVQLDTAMYRLSTHDFSIRTNRSFGVAAKAGELYFFPGDQDSSYLLLQRADKQPIHLEVHSVNGSTIDFTLPEKGAYKMEFGNLKKDTIIGKSTRLKVEG